MSAYSSVRTSYNLSKNLSILMKLGTVVSWYYEKIRIAEGRHWTIGQNGVNRNILVSYNLVTN